MHRTERDILLVFRDEPSLSLGTAQILAKVFPEQAKQAISLASSQQTQEEGSRLKAMLHRRLLYHLNKLESDNLLRVVDLKSRGEKVYALATPGTLVLGKRVTVHLSSPEVSLVDLDHDAVFPFAKTSIGSRVNCVALDCATFAGIHRCDAAVRESIARVNDSVALVHFEHLVRTSSREALQDVLVHWDIDSKDYDKRVCLVLRLSETQDDANLRSFMTGFARLAPKAMRLVLEVTSKDLLDYQSLFVFLVKQFSETRTKINIVNLSLGKSFALGKAGAYALPAMTGATVVASASVIVDVAQALARSRNPADFRRLVRVAARYLLDVARAHRTTMPLEQAGAYGIRLWNYDWEHDLDLIASCRDDIMRFAKDAEIIALSAGLPIRFRIAFGSLTKPLLPELSKRAYKKETVRSADDFGLPQFKDYLEHRERSFGIFDFGDRVRFFREPFTRPEDVVREISILLTAYRIPLFTYDFSEVSSKKTLAEYF